MQRSGLYYVVEFDIKGFFDNVDHSKLDVYKRQLPVHVRCLIDEAANIGQIPRLEKLVATIRSREISACLAVSYTHLDVYKRQT